MLRSTLVVTLLALAESGKIQRAGADNDGDWCYGYLSDGDWCWLTSDGIKSYVKKGDGGYPCESYNGHEDSQYCENGKSSTLKLEEHSGQITRQPKLERCANDKKGYCYGYLAGKDNEWCWLTKDGKRDFAKDLSFGGKYSCTSWNGYLASDYCKDAQSAHFEEGSTHEENFAGGNSKKAGGHTGASGSHSSGGAWKSECHTGWTCPSSWTTGASAPDDAKDAKAFIAAHNIYRCMHDVQAVRWDADVHKGALAWAKKTGTAMVHSSGGNDGENLAGTFETSQHQGVDATHMWYSEIGSGGQYCNFDKSCFQSFTAGHFTAMIWSTINKVAYSDPTGKLAVARYRGCDGNPPNFNNQYKQKVPAPKYNWGYCYDKVLNKCNAFSGLTEDDVEGCDVSSKWMGGTGWYTAYNSKCSAKYADLLSKITARYDIPKVFQPFLVSSPWPAAVASGSVIAIFFVLAARRSPRSVEDSSLDVEDQEEGME